MRLGSTGVLLLFGLSLVACNKPASALPPDAVRTADALTGDSKGSAAANPQCKLFTTAEIKGYGGAPVGAGTNVAMGSGCQWPGAQGDGNGTVMLQIVPARDHEPPSGAPGCVIISPHTSDFKISCHYPVGSSQTRLPTAALQT